MFLYLKQKLSLEILTGDLQHINLQKNKHLIQLKSIVYSLQQSLANARSFLKQSQLLIVFIIILVY